MPGYDFLAGGSTMHRRIIGTAVALVLLMGLAVGGVMVAAADPSSPSPPVTGYYNSSTHPDHPMAPGRPQPNPVSQRRTPPCTAPANMPNVRFECDTDVDG